MTGPKQVALAAGALVALFAGTAALAQPSTKGILAGKLKPGLYEQKITSEMTGLGVPAGQGKSTDTSSTCLTPERITSEDLDMQDGCKVKDVRRTATGGQVTATCEGGATMEMLINSVPNGYRMDVKSGGKGPDGKPFSMTMRVDAQYKGPCKE